MRGRYIVIAFALSAILAACADPEIETQQPPLGRAPALTRDETCATLERSLPAVELGEGWSIVTRVDLLTTDQALWAEHREPSSCPGIAQVDLDGDGSDEFVVALIRRRGDALAERIVLLRETPQGPHAREVWSADTVSFPYVVFSTQTKEAADFYSGAISDIQHGAFVIERMEAWAIVYYEVSGELRNVLISD